MYIGGLKPCLMTKKPYGLLKSRPLADFHALRQGFIPPNQAEKFQMRLPYSFY